jgi:hypothetical protein
MLATGENTGIAETRAAAKKSLRRIDFMFFLTETGERKRVHGSRKDSPKLPTPNPTAISSRPPTTTLLGRWWGQLEVGTPSLTRGAGTEAAGAAYNHNVVCFCGVSRG